MTTQSPFCTDASAGIPPAGLPTEEEILGRAGRENFKVASRLLPPAARSHLMSFYGYARLVDQLGDDYGGDRVAALAWIESETSRALRSSAPGVHPLVARAVASLHQLGMDPAPLYHLIAANRADQTTSEYPTFADLLGYCRLSANPIGRLVLGAFGFTDDQRMAWSDSICSGLQLAEHWQDVAEDGRAGRVYLPVEDLTRFGLSAADVFDRRPGAGASPLFKALMVFEVARARQLLEDGAPLINSLPGRCRWAVAGFYAGGHAALDAIAAQDFDVLAVVARPRPLRVAVRMVSVLGGSRL